MLLEKQKNSAQVKHCNKKGEKYIGKETDTTKEQWWVRIYNFETKHNKI